MWLDLIGEKFIPFNLIDEVFKINLLKKIDKIKNKTKNNNKKNNKKKTTTKNAWMNLLKPSQNQTTIML